MPAPRKPTEAKRRLGTLRPDRQPTALTILPPATVAELAAPEYLGPAGVRIWRLVTQRCPWFASSDMEMVRLLAEAMDRRTELLVKLGQDGWVLYTDKGYAYQHPAAGMLQATEGQITKWLSLLGLDPADRGRLGVAEVKAQSTLEQLRERRERRVGGRPAG